MAKDKENELQKFPKVLAPLKKDTFKRDLRIGHGNEKLLLSWLIKAGHQGFCPHKRNNPDIVLSHKGFLTWFVEVKSDMFWPTSGNIYFEISHPSRGPSALALLELIPNTSVAYVFSNLRDNLGFAWIFDPTELMAFLRKYAAQNPTSIKTASQSGNVGIAIPLRDLIKYALVSADLHPRVILQDGEVFMFKEKWTQQMTSFLLSHLKNGSRQ